MESFFLARLLSLDFLINFDLYQDISKYENICQ